MVVQGIPTPSTINLYDSMHLLGLHSLPVGFVKSCVDVRLHIVCRPLEVTNGHPRVVSMLHLLEARPPHPRKKKEKRTDGG